MAVLVMRMLRKFGTTESVEKININADHVTDEIEFKLRRSIASHRRFDFSICGK